MTVLEPASAAASADTTLVRPASQERAARSTVGRSSMRLPALAVAPRETAARSVFAEAPSGARNEPATAPSQSSTSEGPRMPPKLWDREMWGSREGQQRTFLVRLSSATLAPLSKFA